MNMKTLMLKTTEVINLADGEHDDELLFNNQRRYTKHPNSLCIKRNRQRHYLYRYNNRFGYYSRTPHKRN